MRSTLTPSIQAAALVALALSVAMPVRSAEITRCTDAAGKVSYTDKACPSDTRRAEQLEGLESNGTSYPPTVRPSSPVPAATAAAPAVPVPQDGGLTVIDPRGRDLADARRRAREQQLQDDVDRETGWAYPAPYPHASHRRAARPRDLRPTLRNCDAGGCSDTLGNHYDRSGKVDRYTRPDGRTCRPVGTTVVC